MDNKKQDDTRGGLAKRALAGIGVGQIVHAGLCPVHGLMSILLKTGVVGGSIAAPFVAAHDYLVHDVATPVVSYLRGDDRDYEKLPPYRMNLRTRELVPTNPNVSIAHDVVDYSGWSLALGIPLLFVGSHYRRRKKSQSSKSSTCDGGCV